MLADRSGGNRTTISLRTLLSPALVASVVALVVFFAGIELPAFLADTIDSIGGITSPLAMILMGASLNGVDLKNIALDWRLHLYTLVKQLVLPLAVWFALSPFFPDKTVLGIVVVVLAQQYRSDATYATRAIVVTTLWSFIILPVLGVVVG